MRFVFYSFLLLITFGCVEPYEFLIHDNEPRVVIEGFISDKSYAETQNYPSEGRFFTIKITKTSDVINVRATPIQNAAVKLVQDNNSEFYYQETSAGTYSLLNTDFKAEPGVKYKISIAIGEKFIESDWESLPDVDVPEIGQVNFIEGDHKSYVMEAQKKVIRTIKHVDTSVALPKNSSGQSIFYRWDYTPTWIFIAPLSISVTRPGYKCWATSENYLNSFALQADKSGNYEKQLFRIDTEGNERIWDKFSVLIRQHVLNEKDYFFWKEMKDQVEGSSMIDNPPYNLKSNLFSSSSGTEPVGYFSVVKEQAVRWYFSKDELSYTVAYKFKEGCLIYYGPPAPGCPEPSPGYPACECKYCLDYSNGIATNVKPDWWQE